MIWKVYSFYFSSILGHSIFPDFPKNSINFLVKFLVLLQNLSISNITKLADYKLIKFKITFLQLWIDVKNCLEHFPNKSFRKHLEK